MKDVNEIINCIWNNEAHVQYSLLSGGLSNKSYKVQVGQEEFVLRINGNQNNYLQLNRVEEIKAIKKACSLGLTSPILIADPQHFLVKEYIPGSPVTKEAIHNALIIKDLSGILLKLHKIDGIKRSCSPYSFIEKYMDGIEKHNIPIPKGLNKALQKMNRIENQAINNPQVYCHNDFYTYNIIDNNSELKVIDWELSGMGDVFFDLATLSFSNAFTQIEDEILLQSYFGFYDHEQQIQLDNMKYMNMLKEVTFGLLHSEINIHSGFDFNAFALQTLDRLLNGYVTL